jgi:hypothetical protein
MTTNSSSLTEDFRNGTRRPGTALSDEQICQAVQTGLQYSPASVSLHVGVE